ncbi:uncharacterized protein LOC144353439, partial [Saccoglossus kowalevskii]
ECLSEGASSLKNSAVSTEEEFGMMLFNIANEIGEDEMKSMKDLCGNVYQWISKGDLEKKKRAFDVFQCLREQTIISIGKTEKLEQLLKNIGRQDLVDKIVLKR